MVRLEKEFTYFLTHLEELVKKYAGKYIVIKGEQVLGAYDTLEEAISQTSKTEKIGTFLVQKCNRQEEDYTQTFHSRAIFVNK